MRLRTNYKAASELKVRQPAATMPGTTKNSRLGDRDTKDYDRAKATSELKRLDGLLL